MLLNYVHCAAMVHVYLKVELTLNLADILKDFEF